MYLTLLGEGKTNQPRLPTTTFWVENIWYQVLPLLRKVSHIYFIKIK
jgi:hypothetical protein